MPMSIDLPIPNGYTLPTSSRLDLFPLGANLSVLCSLGCLFCFLVTVSPASDTPVYRDRAIEVYGLTIKLEYPFSLSHLEIIPLSTIVALTSPNGFLFGVSFTNFVLLASL